MDYSKYISLLKLAQGGDSIAEEQLIIKIRDNLMGKRIGRYLHRNRQVEDEDLIQEFLIGVAFAIPRADLNIGNPIDYICTQGVYRVRSYLRKHILQGTTQVCDDCGYETRLNRIGNQYVCKRCGSTHITTRELSNHDETALLNVEDDTDDYDAILSEILVQAFKETLQPGTNLYNLFVLLIEDDVNRDNPDVKNYIKEIAKRWGGCSDNNVVQNMDKLKVRIQKFANDNGFEIRGNQFVVIK